MFGSLSSGNAFQNAPSANTLFDVGSQRFNQDIGQIQQATPQWRGPGFQLTSGGNVPSGLLRPGSEGGSRPISLPPDVAGMARARQQAQQYFGSRYNAPTMPPTTEESGKDTEFGYLTRVGKDMNPIQRDRYNQLIREWQASHLAPAPAPAPSPTPPPVSTPMDQRGFPPTPTGATGLLGGLGNFIGGLFGGGVSPVQTAQSKATQGLQLKSLPQELSLAGQPMANFGQGQFDIGASPSSLVPKPESNLQQLGDIAAIGSLFFPGFEELGVGRLASKIPSVAGKAIRAGGIESLFGGQLGGAQKFLSPDQIQAAFDAWLRQFQTIQTPSGGGPPQIKRETDFQKQSLPPTPISNNTRLALVSNLATPRSSVAAALADQPGIQFLNKQIDIAQKQGNFDEVARLTDIARDANSNMVMQQQIQSIMDAIASSFGVNPAALTAMRQPMVQQGTFQALETPPQQPFTFFGNPREGQMGGQPVFFPNQLREVNPAQLNRPPQFPFANPVMGQNPLGNSPFTTGGQPTNQFLYGKSSVI